MEIALAYALPVVVIGGLMAIGLRVEGRRRQKEALEQDYQDVLKMIEPDA